MTNVTNSNNNQKINKRKWIPKFPSAFVIIFCVLLFVIFLSWMPHKEWVDLNYPLLLFVPTMNGADKIVGGQLQLTNGVPLLEIEAEHIGEYSIILTNFSKYYLLKTFPILDFGFLSSFNFLIKDIKLSSTWSNDVSINFSSLTFQLLITSSNDKTFEHVINVSVDQIHEDAFNNEFLLYKLTFETIYKDESISQIFISGNIDQSWFNFWGTNYYVGDDNGRYGILNIPLLLLGALFRSATIIFYLLCIGAFMQVMIQSGTLEIGTISLVKKMKGKELILVVIFYYFFAFCGTAFGTQSETLGMIPIIVPFIVLVGFDTLTGLLIVTVGTTSGIAASILDPFSIGVMADALSNESIIVPISTGIVIRVIMFIVITTFGASFCCLYAHKARKGKDFVAEPKQYEENKKWAESKIGSLDIENAKLSKRQIIGLGFFFFTFFWMVFVLLPWAEWFPNLITNPYGAWNTISSFFFGKTILGKWTFIQLAIFFIFQAIFISWIFGMKPSETRKAMTNGVMGMLKVSMIIVLSRSVSIVLIYSGLTADMVTLIFGGKNITSEFPQIFLAWILFPIFAFLAIFIPSTSGLAGITGPVLSLMIWELSNGNVTVFMDYALVIMLVYPLAQGTINMCSPTVGIVLLEVERSHVSFGKAFPYLGGAALSIAALGMTVISVSLVVS